MILYYSAQISSDRNLKLKLKLVRLVQYNVHNNKVFLNVIIRFKKYVNEKKIGESLNLFNL